MKTNRIARGQIFMIIVLIFSVLALAVDSRQVLADFPYGPGDFAIFAISQNSDAIVMEGSANLFVQNGSIYSNGGVIKKGSSGTVSLPDKNLLIAMNNGWSCPGCSDSTAYPTPQYTYTDKYIDPTSQQEVVVEKDLEPIAVPQIPVPSCKENSTHNAYIHQGITGKVSLAPGIHCVYGDINLSGSDSLVSESANEGEGVMIVMLNGGIKLSGNATMNLRSNRYLVDGNGTPWTGMLIYVPPTNLSPIQLGGGNGAIISGTVYAPQSTCTLSGPFATIPSSIICNQIKIQGQEGIKLSGY